MTSLKRSKRKQNPDPLGLNVSKRPSNEQSSYERSSDHLGDRIPNDWLEAVAIFLALIAITGAGVTLYHLAGKV